MLLYAILKYTFDFLDDMEMSFCKMCLTPFNRVDNIQLYYFRTNYENGPLGFGFFSNVVPTVLFFPQIVLMDHKLHTFGPQVGCPSIPMLSCFI